MNKKGFWYLTKIRKVSTLKHAVRDFFLRSKKENLDLKKIKSGKVATIFGAAASINALNEDDFPVCDVFICNHFWLHGHYDKIENGYHCISDKLFLKHPRLSDFIKYYNKNITLITTDYIYKKLKENGLEAKVILLNYSGSMPLYDTRNPLSVDITKVLQTGLTVVAEFCFPVAFYMGYHEIQIVGIDMDYGKNLDNYAYKCQDAIFTDRDYLVKIWPQLAKVSVQRWIDYCEQEGVPVYSLTKTVLQVRYL